MSRILADLPDDDIRWLDSRAAEEGRSRASMLREAVATFRGLTPAPANPADWIERGFGYWADRSDVGDGVEYQRAIREDRTAYDQLG